MPKQGAGLPAEAGCRAQHDGHLHSVPGAVLIPHAQQQAANSAQAVVQATTQDLVDSGPQAQIVSGRQDSPAEAAFDAPRLILCRQVAGSREHSEIRPPLMPQLARPARALTMPAVIQTSTRSMRTHSTSRRA